MAESVSRLSPLNEEPQNPTETVGTPFPIQPKPRPRWGLFRLTSIGGWIGDTLAQSVNYAVKSSYLLGFLEAVPEASAGMTDAKTHEQKFEAVVDEVKKATVLIIGY